VLDYVRVYDKVDGYRGAQARGKGLFPWQEGWIAELTHPARLPVER
jgi:hypothetical protein